MKKSLHILLMLFCQMAFSQSSKPELIIADEFVEPGIVFVFEGAIKDYIMPSSMHLSENETHVHIEARVNWDIVYHIDTVLM